MVVVLQYRASDGKIPFEEWLNALHAPAALKVLTAIAQIEAGNSGDHKSVGGGVWERRIHFGKGYRLYYALDGIEIVLLLCGGTKARQQNDIARAKEYWSDYKSRKAGENKEHEAKKADPADPKDKKRRK